MWRRVGAQNLHFLHVVEGMHNEKACAIDNAKSLPWVDSRTHWQHWTTIAVAVSPVAAEHHGREFVVHATLFLSFVFARFLLARNVNTK